MMFHGLRRVMSNAGGEVTVVLGPTAAGKTELAIRLAKGRGAAVISADSRQVYSELDSGTAKPKEIWGEAPHEIEATDKVEGVPHYLLNVAAPTTTYTLAEWQTAALKILQHLEQVGQPAILAGGTMLYVDSIFFNYLIPEITPDHKLRGELEKLSAEKLWVQLIQKDPAARQFIEPHHKRRMIRALEVMAATGQPFSDMRKKRPSPYRFKIIGLFPGWEVLRARIRQRAQIMLEGGLLEETDRLRQKYGTDLPLLRTMNYLQAGKLLDGELSKEAALTEMVRVNMRYAHRQMNWWKNNQGIKWIK